MESHHVRFDRDQNFFRHRQGIEREDAQRRRAIDQDIIPRFAREFSNLFFRMLSEATSLASAFSTPERSPEEGIIWRSFDFGFFDDILEFFILGQHIEKPFAFIFKAIPQRSRGLRVEIDQQNFFLGFGQGGRQIDRSGRFSRAALSD